MSRHGKFVSFYACTQYSIVWRILLYKIDLFVLTFFRDLSMIRSEVNKSARTVQGACMDLDKNMRSVDSNIKLELEEEREKRVQVSMLHLWSDFILPVI